MGMLAIASMQLDEFQNLQLLDFLQICYFQVKSTLGIHPTRLVDLSTLTYTSKISYGLTRLNYAQAELKLLGLAHDQNLGASGC